MVTMVTQFWAKCPVVSAVRVPVRMGPKVDVTLLLLVTRTTVTNKLSATATRVTQVNYVCCLVIYVHISSSSPSVLVFCSSSSPESDDTNVVS